MTRRVLVVAHAHPAHGAGGAEIAAYQLFQQLRRMPEVSASFLAAADRTNAAAAIAPFPGRADEYLYPSRDVDEFLYSQRSAAVLADFRALIERLAPDIVHFHHYHRLGCELIGAARQAAPATRILLTLHEYRAICAHFGQMVKTGSLALCPAASPGACAGCYPGVQAADFAARERGIRSQLTQVDRFIAPSEFLRRRYVEWGLPPERIVVLENGTAAVQAPAPRPFRRGERRSVFGFFGQINPFKGLVEVLTAIGRLGGSREAGDIRLIVNGAYLEENDPAFVATVRDLLARTGSRVRFAGPYRREALSRLMAMVDWVVVPSIWWENAPLVIEEALAHRRPVICSDIGGMAEKVRPGLDGHHFPVGDPAALAEVMARVAADLDGWNALKQTMRRPVTIEEAAAAHRALYESV